MPASTMWSMPSSASSRRSSRKPWQQRPRDARGVQPAEPDAGLRCGLGDPRGSLSWPASWAARSSVLAASSARPCAASRLEPFDADRDPTRRRLGGLAHLAPLPLLAADGPAPAGEVEPDAETSAPAFLNSVGHRLDQLVPAVLELLDTFALEHVDHVVVRDADPLQPVEHVLRLGVMRPDRVLLDDSVVVHGLQGGLRHRVDDPRRDQVGDVHRVGVARVLHAGRGPQRPLGMRAGRFERLPAVAAEDLLVMLVCQPGVGDAGLAAQRLAPRRRPSCRAACRSRCRPGRRRTTRPNPSWTGRRREARSRSMPSRKASMTASYRSRPKISVTLTLMPSLERLG